MNNCGYKSRKFWIIAGVAAVATAFISNRLIKSSYKPTLGSMKDFRMKPDKFKAKLLQVERTDGDKIKWQNYTLFNIPYLNDIELAYVYYDSGKPQEGGVIDKEESKKRVKIYMYSKAEIMKRGIYDDTWINDPYQPSNKEYYQRTGNILGK